MNYASASQRYLAVLGSQPEAAGRVAEGLARIGEHAGQYPLQSASGIVER